MSATPIREALDAPAVAIPTRGATGVRVANLSGAGVIATYRFGTDDTVESVDGDVVVMPGKALDVAIPVGATWIAVRCPGGRVNLGWYGARAAANDELEDGMTTKTVTITSAQLKDLRANPVELVPAPGLGYAIVPVSVFMDYNYGSIAYTGVGATVVLSQYSQGELFTGFLDQAADSTHIAEPSGVETRAAVNNAALQLKNTGGSDLAAGNGILTVTVLYRTVALG